MAEVLITLTIIGIVAALTMPTLVVKNQQKETVSKLKKMYSVLSQAYSLSENEYGKPEASNWNLNNKDEKTGKVNAGLGVLNTLAVNLKVLENCGITQGCLPVDKYLDANGTNYINMSRVPKPSIILNDGTFILYSSQSVDCDEDYGTTKQLLNLCGIIDVDINGEKGPNVIGQDMFSFYLTKYGIIPDGLPDEKEDNASIDTCVSDGWGCTAWIIYNENMDYKICPEELGWDKSAKCSKK